MNKQFLSLLLLTAFVPATTSASAIVPSFTSAALKSFIFGQPVVTQAMVEAAKTASIVAKPTMVEVAKAAVVNAPVVARTAFTKAGEAVAGVMAREGVRNTAFTTAVIGTPVAAMTALENSSSIGGWINRQLNSVVPQEVEKTVMQKAKALAARGLAATKAGFTSAVNTVRTNPKMSAAIAAGVAVTAGLSYLACNKYFSQSISLNDQQRASVKAAVVEANRLAVTCKNVFQVPADANALTIENHFTTASGLSTKVVDALNKYLSFKRAGHAFGYLAEHQNGGQPARDTQKAYQALAQQELARLQVTAA